MTKAQDRKLWAVHRAAVAKGAGADFWAAQQAGFRATDPLERINRKAMEKPKRGGQ
jgi:hypothetical protein